MSASSRSHKALLVHVLAATLLLGLLPLPPKTYADPPSPPPLVPLPELGAAAPDVPASDVRNALGGAPAPSLGRTRGAPGRAKALGAAPTPTAGAQGASLLRPADAPLPVPGIQRAPLAKEGMLYQKVEPPRSPFELVKHFPNEYLPPGVALPPPGAGPAPQLRVRPGELRFALTSGGLVPARQTLEIRADSRRGVAFELAEVPEWLDVSVRRGKASFDKSVIDVSVLERRLDGVLEGEMVVRNVDDPGDVRRIPVRLSVLEGDRFEPLRSYDEDGRLQRVVRADGGIIDYEYDEYGQLTRIRYPDGTSVGYSYDDAGRRTSMVDGQGTTVYRYDEDGRLAAVYQPGFNPVRYKWDDEDRLAAITYPHGRVVSYGYDEAGRLASVHEDAGTTTYRYGDQGRLLGQTLPNGISTDYGYDESGRIVEVLHQDGAGDLVLGFRYTLDERGLTTGMERQTPDGVEVTSYGYDEAGRVVQADYPSGRSVSYEYDGLGNRLRTTETEGADVEVTDYYYDEAGRLFQAGAETFEYDVHGNVVARFAPGRTVEYGYDFEGRLTSYRDAEHAVLYAYDADSRRVKVTVDGKMTLYGNDISGTLGDVLFDADAEAGILRSYSYGFERIGRADVLAVDDEFFLYDRPLHNVSALSSAAREVTQIHEYDVLGAPSTPGEEMGFLFGGASYDPVASLLYLRGRYYDPGIGLHLSPVPASRAGETYWQNQLEANRALPGSFAERLARAIGLGAPADGSGQRPGTADGPISESAPTQIVIFQSNQLPDTGLSKNATRPRTSLPFPDLAQFSRGSTYRRPVARKSTPPPRFNLHPEYLRFVNTPAGLVPTSQTLEIQSNTGEPIDFTLTEDIPWLSVDLQTGTATGDPTIATVSIDEFALGAPVGDLSGSLSINSATGQVPARSVRVALTVDDTAAAPTLISADFLGNIQRVVKPDGEIVDYKYDREGRLTEALYSDETIRYTYDGNGNRVTMTDHRGVSLYSYDEKNRLIAITHPQINPIRYTWDKAGRLVAMIYPDGSTVDYSYDSDDRLVEVSGPAGTTTYSYDATTGLLASRTLPNGVTTSYAYDSDGRLTDVEHRDAAAGLIGAFGYSLNQEGLRTSVTQTMPSSGPETTLYTYDDLYRVTHVAYPDGRQVSYTYDPYGNRTSMAVEVGGVQETLDYEYDTRNQMIRAGETLFQYDKNGNMVRRVSPQQTTEYTYDSRNRLLKIQDEADVFEFEYDGDDHRVVSRVNGSTRRFVNSSLGPTMVLMESDVNWSLLKTYSYGLERFGTLTEGSDWRFYLSDSKSVFALVDAGGVTAEQYSYDAFGEPRNTGSANDFFFNGEYLDSSGLIYLRARYYDPAIGRFLSRDIAPGRAHDVEAQNPYVFVRNNPLNYIDITGLDSYLVSRQLKIFSGGSHRFVVVDADYPGDPNARIYSYGELDNGNLGRLFDNTYTTDQAAWANLQGGSRPPSVTFAQIPASDFTVEFYAGALRENLQYGWFGPNSNSAAQAISNRSSGTDVFVKENRFLGAPGIGKWQDIEFDFPVGDFEFNSSISNIASNNSLLGGRDLGGVDLNKTADLLLEIDDIAGATYDESTGQLVLFGEQDVSLPEMDLDDMAVAVDSVFMGQDPGVSIDPPIQNGQMSVRYEGETMETEFGWVMFEADRVLKILSLGKDNLTGASVTSAVTGYQSMLDRRLEVGCNSLPDSTRMWFQPKEVKLVRSADGQTMLFDVVSMELLYESKIGDQVVSDPQAAAFASHFTDNYDSFANEWPILRELERLGKIVAVMKWIKDNSIPIDLSFIENYSVEFFSTPTATPVVSASGTTGSCQITLTGGVTYRPPNEYLADDPVDPTTDAVRDDALVQRPSETDFLWTFRPSESARSRLKGLGNASLTAVAQSFTRSRKDGNLRFSETDLSYPATGTTSLELTRYYDSFGDRPSSFGSGWRSLPYELRFPVAAETFTFGPNGVTFELPARIWVAERPNDREDAYELIGIDDGDLPLYLRSGAMDLLRQEVDGSYLLVKVDGSRRSFGPDGRLLSTGDPNGNVLAYLYDANGRLQQIQAPDGRSIVLVRDPQDRVAQASGPGGRQLTYAYNGAGLLRSVTEGTSQVRTYTYDADGRLQSAVDVVGDTIFDGTYDDYNRASRRRIGSAAELNLAYDLEARSTTITGPFGETSVQRFDEHSRLMEQVDPLGNRVDIAYDGDFGPASIVDSRGAVTQVAYDQRGNLTTVIDTEGGIVELFYGAGDRLIAKRDAEGVESAFGYDGNNLTVLYHTVVLHQDELGSLTSFSFDPTNVTTFTYNSDGTLASWANPSDQTGQFTYDLSGQLDSATSPEGLVTRFGYDARFRPGSVETGGLEVTLGHDDSDRLTTVTTTAGMVQFGYDGNGRLTGVTDAEDLVTTFTYDADSNLSTVQDAALGITRYTYDVVGNLTAVELPNGIRTAYRYDELNRPVVTFTGRDNPTPDLGFIGDTLDFSSVGLGAQSTLSLNLYNLAAVPLTISGVTTSAPFATDFVGSTVIAPGDFLTVNVTFTPSAAGPAADNLTVTSDDPDDPVHLVALTGVGTVMVVNLVATPASDGIQLDWDPFDPGAQTFVHFNIYRSTSPIDGDVGGLTPIDESLTDATATGFRDRSAEPGTSYYYAVTPEFTDFEPTAVDAVGPVAFFTSFDVVGPASGLATSADDETRPAVAYNSTAGEYLLVYEQDTSGAGTNLDVLGQRLDADGTLIGAPFNIASRTVTERRPRLAYNSSANDYLVVFEEDFNGDGSNFVVYGQRVNATGGLIGGAFFVGGFTLNETHPEIAYNSTGNDYFVVWEMDGDVDGKLDVVGQRISAAGAKLGGTFFVGGISVGGTPVVDQNPHLTYNATDDEYLVAYEVDVNDDGSDFEILGSRYSGAGAYLSGPFFLGSTVHAVTGAALQDQNPYVGHDSGHNQYLTLWDVEVAGDGSNWSIASQKTDVLGAPISLLDGFLVVVDTAAQERNARQVYNPTADEHLLVWDESSAADPRILARRYRLTASSLLWGGVLEVATGAAVARQRPAGAFNSTSNEMLVAWESDTGSGFDVEGSRLGNVAPVLDVDPPALDFGSVTVNLGLTVSNTGNGTLDWVANSDQPWLAATPPSGGTTGSAAVTVSVDRTGLLPGSFNATLSVQSNGGTVAVPVTMTVPNTPPDTPHSPLPGDGASGQSAPDGTLDLTLGWQSGDADGDAVTYDLYFATDAALVTAEDPSVRHSQGLAAASASLSGLQFLTSYAWRVVAFDSRGDSTSGPTWSFTTVAIPAPQLFEVLPDPTNVPRPVLTWQAVTGASGYDLQVDDDASFASPLVDASGLAATSFTPSSDLPEGALHWRVRSRDGNAQPGPFSTVDSFTADRTAPAAPVLVPVAPDPTRDARPDLAWGLVAGAASYLLQVSTDAAFLTLLVDLTLSGVSHEPAASLPEGTVHWRVASRDAAGNQSGFSAADTFAVDLTSPPPVTGLAASRSGNDVDLTWDPLAGPPADFDHFNVYRSALSFDNVSGLTPLSSALTDAAAVAFTDTTASPGTAFFYAVTAVDSVGNENKTVTSALLPGNLSPLAPNLPVPGDGASNLAGPDVSLAWEAADPDSPTLTFDVYLGQNEAQITAQDITTRVAQDLTLPSFLAAGLDFATTHFWRVVAFDDRGASTAGPVWSFTTGGMAAPVLVVLTPDPTNNPRPTFGWQAVAGAATYRLQIDDDAGFGSTLVDAPGLGATSFTPSSDLPEGTLHWRVRGITSQGQNGLFSAADSFVTDRTPPAVPTPTPVSPDPSPLRRPELRWNVVASAATYRVRISTDPNFGSTLVDVTVSSPSFRPTSDLADGLYYWHVSSRDQVGNESAFSAADDFTVDFSLSGPIFLDGFESGNVSQWSSVTGGS